MLAVSSLKAESFLFFSYAGTWCQRRRQAPRGGPPKEGVTVFSAAAFLAGLNLLRLFGSRQAVILGGAKGVSAEQWFCRVKGGGGWRRGKQATRKEKTPLVVMTQPA
jgi:hypothetical protein